MLKIFKSNGISKPVFFLGLASLFTDAASEMIYPLLPSFLTKYLGATAAFVGLLEGVAETTAATTKFFFGWLSDRLRKRTPFVVGGYTLANAVRPFIGIATLPWQVLVLRFTDRIGKGMRTAPRDAWLATLADGNRRGTIFGFHRAMDHAGAVIGPLLATAFLWFYPGELRRLFVLSIIPGLAAAAFVVAAAKNSKADHAPIAISDPAMPTMGRLPASFKRYLSVLTVFTLGSSTDIFLLLKLQTVGVDPKWVPLLWSALHVVKSAGSMPGGWLGDRIGHKRGILMGWLTLVAAYFILGVSDRMDVVIGAFLFYGFYPALTESSEKALIAGMVPDHTRGKAFGLHNLVTGLGAFPASVLFGYLWTHGSPRLAFFVGAGIALIAAIALLFLSLGKKEFSPPLNG